MSERVPILYLAPWIIHGGSDKNTIDWFRWIDRERFAPYLITTQPSPNPLISEVASFAEEVWVLPDLMPAEDMPRFILDFLESRDVRVIHLMNSRLGFDLLPDCGCLPNPPSVVVQLHVEETDRSGYVRYVTTRYGNLVDRFSISNRHVAEAVHGYGIPREKTRVIYTGVDADEEFSPERSEPIEQLPDDRLQILFAARLTQQKDPLLMVDVAAALRDRGVKFQIHVVGEGDLEKQLTERIGELGLVNHVVLHPPTPGLQGWYSACDALLLTSEFEGVPCVLFEAMAMGLPIVAPGLPGIRELLSTEGDCLVERRDSVSEYVEFLTRLADDRVHRDALGSEMRNRAKEQFSVQQMAADHGELYEELFAAQAKPTPEPTRQQALEPIRFTGRPVVGDPPLVSVLIPHFNQAPYLAECLEAVRAQTYPNLEVILVDDASTEDRAGTMLDEIEGGGDVEVIRLKENGGPSHARNVGLERCSGRYVLPVDSDNLLLPDAVEKLVEQLSTASEDIGFIYPNIQYFGNREDYYEVPEYNLYTLLYGNFCDTCSLLDREIFDAGIRYNEDIRLGHEDWEFVLRLAARGVRGEAARGPTIRYRKWGFNRSDLVDHGGEDFRDDTLAEISPFKGLEAEIKAQEAPVLSIVPLATIDVTADSGRELAAQLSHQSCIDVELIGRVNGEWPNPHPIPPAQRLPAALAESPIDALRHGLKLARGSYVAITSGTGGVLLADPAFVDRVLRRFSSAAEKLDAIALVDAGAGGRYPFRSLASPDDPTNADPHTVIWRREVEHVLPWGLHADPGAPVPSLVRLLSGAGAQLDWRHLTHAEPSPRGEPEGTWIQLPGDPAAAADPHGLRPAAQPLLPGTGRYRVPRWNLTPSWTPPLSTIATRYREPNGDRRLVTNGPRPAGFFPEHHLGALRSTAMEGTARIVQTGDSYQAIPRGKPGPAPDGDEIGYVELAGLPGMDVLALAVIRATGQTTLVTLPDDPLLEEADVIDTFGYLDPFPLKPRSVPSAQPPLGLVGLLKAVDYEAGRHRYEIGAAPQGALLGELGGLAESELQGSIAVWIVDGYLVTPRHAPPPWKPAALAALRWAAEPVIWRGLASPAARVKAIAGRTTVAGARRARPSTPATEASGAPAGWLFESYRPGLAPLFASYHPVTGDQLLTRSREDAAHMGYVAPWLLGFVRKIAPVTGDLSHLDRPIPWARRSGAVPQTG